MSEPHTDAERDLHDFYKFPVGEETTAAAFDAWWEDPATPSLLADGWTEYFLAFKAGVEWAGARTPTLPAGAAPYDDMTDFEDATHVIREWVQGDPVITTALTRELLYWASWAAGDRPPAEREGESEIESLLNALLPGRMLQLVAVPARPRSEPYGSLLLMVYKFNSTDLECMAEADTLTDALRAAQAHIRAAGDRPPAEREETK